MEVGGDLRVAGTGPGGGGWAVGVASPEVPAPDATEAGDGDDPGQEAASGNDRGLLGIADGGVATSSPCRRRWQRDGSWMHHLIDSRRGKPAQGALASLTVVAADATTAEVLATAGCVAGAEVAADLLAAFGAAGLAVTAGGQERVLGDWGRFLIPRGGGGTVSRTVGHPSTRSGTKPASPTGES